MFRVFQRRPGAGSASASGTSFATSKRYMRLKYLRFRLRWIKGIQTLSWARFETPAREMSWTVNGHLKALRLEGHEVRVAADNTRHSHVHMIANPVDPQIGKASKLENSKPRPSRCAEGLRTGVGRDPVRAPDKEERMVAGGRGGGSDPA